MTDVPAVRVDDIEADGVPAGAFEFFYKDGKAVGMIYKCPCGCGCEGALNFRPHASPSWEWDGNEDKPTLSPSVHHQFTITTTGEKKTHWHGWLKQGVWTSC